MPMRIISGNCWIVGGWRGEAARRSRKKSVVWLIREIGDDGDGSRLRFGGDAF